MNREARERVNQEHSVKVFIDVNAVKAGEIPIEAGLRGFELLIEPFPVRPVSHRWSPIPSQREGCFSESRGR